MINVTKMAKKAHKLKMEPFWQQMNRLKPVEAIKWMISLGMFSPNELGWILDQLEAEKARRLMLMANFDKRLASEEGRQEEIDTITKKVLREQENKRMTGLSEKIALFVAAVIVAFSLFAYMKKYSVPNGIAGLILFWAVAGISILAAIVFGYEFVAGVMAPHSDEAAREVAELKVDSEVERYRTAELDLGVCDELIITIREAIANTKAST